MRYDQEAIVLSRNQTLASSNHDRQIPFLVIMSGITSLA